MSLRNLRKEAILLIDKLLQERKIDGINYTLVEPPNTAFGELTSNIAFQLAQQFRSSPYLVAKDLQILFNPTKNVIVESQ
jgi:arginyl-tRNA synthetase